MEWYTLLTLDHEKSTNGKNDFKLLFNVSKDMFVVNKLVAEQSRTFFTWLHTRTWVYLIYDDDDKRLCKGRL